MTGIWLLLASWTCSCHSACDMPALRVSGGFTASVHRVVVQVTRYGKLKAYMLSIVVVCVSGVVTYFTLLADEPVYFCLALGVMGFGSAGTSIIINVMLSDAIDYDELHTGKRRESTYHVCTLERQRRLPPACTCLRPFVPRQRVPQPPCVCVCICGRRLASL